jgi:hypothetical protein
LGYDSFGFIIPLKQYFSKIGTRETFVYQNFSLGKITKVDLQNPLKIVLFYENFNTVVTLDNQLNEIQKSIFPKVQFLLPQLLASLRKINFDIQ